MSSKYLDHFYMDNQLINTSFNENLTTGWIESLALEELNMEETGVINFTEHLNPVKLLEESSIHLMEALKERFEIYATKFNEFRGNQSGQIKSFKISNTVNDFMLYRNALKLVVARRSEDIISIGFLSNTGGLFSARLNFEQSPSSKIHEIKAHVGAFNKISWKFNGENVDIDALTRHYLTEFIKHSAR